jgi:hypothetical protein
MLFVEMERIHPWVQIASLVHCGKRRSEGSDRLTADQWRSILFVQRFMMHGFL